MPPTGPVYLDTSALVPLYLREPASESLSRSLVGRRDVLLTDLVITEFASALARRKREGALPGETCARIQGALLKHVADEHYLKIGITPDTHRAAERMLLSAGTAGLKAADALHLAAAVSFDARLVASLDERMRGAATAAGLEVLPAAR